MSVAVEYRNVSFTYPKAGAPALDSISLSVDAGIRLGILGPNGGGKSTLLKLTLGLLRPQRGSISIMGMPVQEARRAGIIGYVPQRNEAELAFPISVRHAVSMTVLRSLRPWQSLSRESHEAVTQAMEVVGISHLADHPVGKLSGGQLQRAMIARAIAARPSILLLDEPTVGIDVSGQQQFAEMLTALHQALKLTVIVVSHDIRTVAAGCDRIACLSRTLHSHVSPEGLTPRVLAEVFRHDVAAIFGDVHVDAHAASSCSDPSHQHAPIGLTISSPRKDP